MMLKRVPFLTFLLLALTLTHAVQAQGPRFPGDSDPTWQATYWNNKTLSGTPVLQRSEANLDYDWGAGSPHSSVNADGFSARWTRYIYTTEDVYRFSAISDDGIRVYLDGERIIDEWYDRRSKTVSVEKSLSTGHHWVVVEFYENQGRAVAKFLWESTSAPAQGNWHGEYYNNMTLDGTAALVRDDAAISFDWGKGSPATGVIGADMFSVRWTGTMALPAGRYRFKMTVDDGGRLWVNNHLLIDEWKDQAAQTYTEEIYLSGGSIPIKMEYYEHGHDAIAKLSWESLAPTIHNWRGEYFDNTTLNGTPALVRDDHSIDFNWGDGSPAPSAIASDYFSSRWTRAVDFSSGRYRFTLTSDDGARLWVNGHLLIDAWYDHAEQTFNNEIDLSGAVSIKMEYYERTGQAVVRLSWSPVSAPPPPLGGVIVDDAGPGFVKGGASASWRTVYAGYGGRMLWTKNNDWAQPYYNWARWYPSLSSGYFEVFVFIPERYSTTTSARYWVHHADGYTQRIVNQSASGGLWVSLGTYRFGGGDQEFVSLSDVTGEERLSRLIAFDAVKWVSR